MAIWNDSFEYAGKRGFGAELVTNETFKGGFHMEPDLGFHFKLDHLYCLYPS